MKFTRSPSLARSFYDNFTTCEVYKIYFRRSTSPKAQSEVRKCHREYVPLTEAPVQSTHDKRHIKPPEQVQCVCGLCTINCESNYIDWDVGWGGVGAEGVGEGIEPGGVSFIKTVNKSDESNFPFCVIIQADSNMRWPPMSHGIEKSVRFSLSVVIVTNVHENQPLIYSASSFWAAAPPRGKSTAFIEHMNGKSREDSLASSLSIGDGATTRFEKWVFPARDLRTVPQPSSGVTRTTCVSDSSSVPHCGSFKWTVPKSRSAARGTRTRIPFGRQKSMKPRPNGTGRERIEGWMKGWMDCGLMDGWM